MNTAAREVALFVKGLGPVLFHGGLLFDGWMATLSVGLVLGGYYYWRILTERFAITHLLD